jgi:hypothetical protein
MFADAQLQAGVLPPELSIKKEHHLRPPQLHRRIATDYAPSSGQRSLTGFEQPGTRAIKTKKRSPPMLYEIAPFLGLN